MATAAENIETAINALAAEIAANPSAVSYSIDGQSVSHDQAVAKLKGLMELRGLAQGPVEVESYGVV
jgi:hypothetical protein